MSNLFDESSLAMIPTAYKEDKLYSLRPTDGSGDFTFSRGSNLAATRVGADGLIEKGRENIVLYSNKFDESYWSKLNGCSIVGQTATDPFGVTNNAWLVSFDGTSNGRIEKSLSGSQVKTMSIYVRTQSGTQDVMIGFGGSELSTFTATTTWQRIEKFTPSNIYPRLRCDSATTLEVFGFQVELGLVATPYIETGATTAQAGLLENTPRLDYSGGATCPSLLLEPSRTNLITNSDYVDWGIVNVLLERNYGISPEGLKNSLKVTSTSTLARLQTSITLPVNTDFTFSFFIKNIDSNQSRIYGVSDTIIYNIFWNGATISSVSEGLNYQSFGNGWYRVWETSQSDSSSLFRIYPQTVAGGDSIEIYGLQLEQGSYATSYIPTYGVSQTRAEENRAIELSVLDFFSLGTSESGTFFIETKYINSESSSRVTTFSQGGSGNNLWTNDDFQIRNTEGSDIFLVQNINDIIDDYIKIIIRKNGTTYNVFVNGTKSSTTVTITNPLKWFEYIALWENKQMLKQLIEFPTALTDSECIALTTI